MAQKKNELTFKYTGYTVTQISKGSGSEFKYVYKIGNSTCTNIKQLETLVTRLQGLKAGSPIKPTKVHKDKSKYTRKKKHKNREKE